MHKLKFFNILDKEILYKDLFFSIKKTGAFLEASNTILDILNNEIEFSYIKKIVKFYVTEIDPDFDVDKNLTKTQKMLYGLDTSPK